jgi:hypothetical protein
VASTVTESSAGRVGPSEVNPTVSSVNAVKTQVWTAISVYVLVAILKDGPPSTAFEQPPIWSSVMHRAATPCGSGGLWTSRAGFSPVDRRAGAMHRCELLPKVSCHRVSKAKAAAAFLAGQLSQRHKHCHSHCHTGGVFGRFCGILRRDTLAGQKQ